MNLRVVLAGLAGGVAMFIWGFVAHMMLPLGEAGLKALPYEESVLTAVSAHIKEPGFYLFPWPESPAGTPMPMSAEARKKAEELYKTFPHGMLLFYPPPGPMMTGGQLVIELTTNVLSSFIAAVLVHMTLGSVRSFFKRALFVAVLGLSAGIAVNVPHWNWYGFPAAFTLGEIVEHVVGFGIVGLVLAAILKPAETTSADALRQPARIAAFDS